jgi:hypothetical protein
VAGVSAECPHCGKPNARTDRGRIDRHYRADHRSGIDPGNQLCEASFTRPAIGEACQHLTPNPHCVGGPA